MTTLVLGSGQYYAEHGGDRCLPIPQAEFDAIEGKVRVDNEPDIRPDVLMDLERPWPFESKSVESVIDTTGLGTQVYGSRFWKELFRVLRPGAGMISMRRASGSLDKKAEKHGFVVYGDDKSWRIVRPLPDENDRVDTRDTT